ncbi:putative fatty acyl-CoA reductase CG5065 [Diorhabda carinulata]|uniref:putative fatty acyl-CoA reductase CG5065 n=1 Tax=Diorhabda carinulata TaxID=1163345 RepID=UPI0025A0D7C4|nr:putative fatty acyl-CoA reductase CG5065 [Diorhabda carinulata]XP_057671021.1 putative fatty acyl-CoA reductase CG5065 [Diorhabda carinulata]XP_057671022.1 putative fatty acyl-CoA reductase CG5065 [Diorhabda carinulata]XP_057671024.1 putative fatty acyl-CoA reductase CG5065 [Diorhabda carinulata]XP_057671025.1 putative fatty acyl-CoA reductase CG5065 [Diorhabda carinulata]XP_057671026.1 putative fatty acyl-CoA reductase CG5065 [Diorhabda carinulata]
MLKEERMSALQNTVNNSSSISEFYNGKTLFITGCTGFMGKVLLEKLLRSCPGVAKIYLLIRPKKGQLAHERLQQLLHSPLFDTIRKERPSDLQKVLPIEGDITQPELNISVSDRAVLERSVNIVFHSAATVKFDEKLKLSVTINMLGTQRLVELCKRMDHLEALVHVSTAYCNCDRNEVKETIYPPPIDPDHIVTLVETLDEELVDSFTSKLIGNRPNTYTFTKALAECWLQKNKGDLPIVIIRPSIVLSSIKEPLKGWVDNWNGPTGIIAAAGKGLIRTMLCDPNKIADLVPVDMVINLMIVSAWRIGTNSYSKEIPIYNCVSGLRKPIKWKEFVEYCFKFSRKHPVSDVSFYPQGTITSYKFVNKIRQIIWHWIPAYVIDAAVKISGGKPILMRIQEKIEKAATCLEYFTTKEWKFDDENVRQLAMTLNDSDREEFCFDVARIDWEQYLENYVLGIRRFIFKEDVATLPKARQNISKLFWTYKILKVVSVMCMWYFLTLRSASLRRLWGNALRLLIHLARMLPFI